MKALLELVARSLVDHPDRVEVTETRDGEATRLELRVAPEDLGKVIGKQGRTARSIRTLLDWGGARRQQGVGLEIVE